MNDTVEMRTVRPFDTKDPLDAVFKMDSIFNLAFAAGVTADTEWEQRTDLGRLDLFASSVKPQELVVEVKTPFEEARIKAYEIHGWLCLVAWFPLGFALIATKRYYKTRWFLMHHSHNFIGFVVTAVTIGTCLQVYAHVDWEQKANAHSVLGLIALLLTIFAGVTGMITAGMMQWYNGDKAWAERDKVYKVAKVHRYSSYFMLLLGNGVCSGGIATYFSKIGYGIWGTFGVSSSIFFLLMLALHEFFMRRFNRKNFKLIEGDELAHLIEKQ